MFGDHLPQQPIRRLHTCNLKVKRAASWHPGGQLLATAGNCWLLLATASCCLLLATAGYSWPPDVVLAVATLERLGGQYLLSQHC